MSKDFNFTGKPFQSVKEACASTGLSQFFLRQGVNTGSVPHIRAGKKILINVPLLMEQLNERSVRPTAERLQP